MTTQEVGQRLRELRVKAKLSQGQVARGVGLTQGSVSNYETGKRDMGFTVAVRYAQVLGVRLQDLAGGN